MTGSRRVYLYQSVFYLDNPGIVSSDSNLKHTGVSTSFFILHIPEATSISTLQTDNRQNMDFIY